MVGLGGMGGGGGSKQENDRLVLTSVASNRATDSLDFCFGCNRIDVLIRRACV